MHEKKFIGLVNETSKSVQFQSSRSLKTRKQVYKTEKYKKKVKDILNPKPKFKQL